MSREVLKHDNIQEVIVNGGQHYDANISNSFFEEMRISKPYDTMIIQIIKKIEVLTLKEKSDGIVAYRDINSTLAKEIVGSKLHIQLAHMDTAIQNFKNEGFDNFNCKVVKDEDIILNGAFFYKKLVIKLSYDVEENYVLFAVHRAENTDDENQLKAIFKALNKILKKKRSILPLHSHTKEIVEKLKINIKKSTIIDPIGSLEMIYLIDNGEFQKEAYFFSKPCITLRDEMEWVDNGFNVLVDLDKDKKQIISAYKKRKISDNFLEFSLYENGKMSRIIVESLIGNL